MRRPRAPLSLGLLAAATVVFALILVPPLVQAANAVAMVADLQGKVTLKGRPLDLMMDVPAGAELALADGASVTLLALSDGTETTVTGPGSATISAEGVSTSGGAEAASAQPQIAALSLRPDDYQQAAVVMRGAAHETVSGMVPNGGHVLELPRLTWTGESASACTVTLRDGEGAVLYEAPAEGHALVLPADLAVAPGTTVAWTLDCADAKPREAVFTLAGADLADRFLAVTPGQDAPFAHRLGYARALAAAGLEHDSRQAFHRLAAERPDSMHLRILANLPLDGPVPPLP